MTEEGTKKVTTDPLLREIKELRQEMQAGFKDLGLAIDKRKDAQHELQLECGRHRGGYDQKILALEKDRDDAERE